MGQSGVTTCVLQLLLLDDSDFLQNLKVAGFLKDGTAA